MHRPHQQHVSYSETKGDTTHTNMHIAKTRSEAIGVVQMTASFTTRNASYRHDRSAYLSSPPKPFSPWIDSVSCPRCTDAVKTRQALRDTT